MVKVKIIKKYFDTVLKKEMLPNEMLEVDPERALVLCTAGVCEIIKMDKLNKKLIY